MNLEDYAYNENDRWYVDPRVSLDEQNAFINNLRNAQAQNNAQIEQQVQSLGTQVPSQLGGLAGAGSYFRSRFQTPQTNQTVAELRAGMQAQALNQALQNEYKKAKKAYNDAQNEATSRNNTTNNLTNTNPDVVQNSNNAGTPLDFKLEDTVTEKYDGKTEWETTEGEKAGEVHSLDPNSENPDELLPKAGESGQDWEKRLRGMGYSLNDARSIMFEVNKRKRADETYEEYKKRLERLGVDKDEIQSLVYGGQDVFMSDDEKYTVDKIKESLGW